MGIYLCLVFRGVFYLCSQTDQETPRRPPRNTIFGSLRRSGRKRPFFTTCPRVRMHPSDPAAGLPTHHQSCPLLQSAWTHAPETVNILYFWECQQPRVNHDVSFVQFSQFAGGQTVVHNKLPQPDTTTTILHATTQARAGALMFREAVGCSLNSTQPMLKMSPTLQHTDQYYWKVPSIEQKNP